MSEGFSALIPLKGHSQRVPGKNLRQIAGRPLFHWVCKALRDAPSITRIVIDTDSDEVESAVRSFDPSIVILRRPKELQGDSMSVNRLIGWQISQLDGDDFLQTHATSPLLTAATIENVISAFRGAPESDSLFTVTRHQARMYDRDGHPINHNPDELIETQKLPPVYEENSCLYVFTRQSFARHQRRIGASPMMFETPHPDDVDIDTEEDFAFATYLLDKRENLK
ncbi:MAG: acylneuraminate cytidylyltransferase family protein [Rhodospirillales bacterium]